MDDAARPSGTAFRVALRRAAHQILDSPLVLDDPIALRIVGARAERELRASPAGHRLRIARALRAFIVVRSRLAEDALAAAVARGVAQYVVLGAGLDTFAYRNPFPGLRVFEVDHPATQAWKRVQIADASIGVPASVTYAPVNFEHQTLADGLASAGFHRDAPAFFSWLGVTMYLTEAAVMATFGYMASTAPGGGVAFDYGVPRHSLSFVGRIAHDVMANRVAAAGEPFQTFFDPADLASRLAALGFSSVLDWTADDLNARYFKDREDGLHVSGQLGRVMTAIR